MARERERSDTCKRKWIRDRYEWFGAGMAPYGIFDDLKKRNKRTYQEIMCSILGIPRMYEIHSGVERRRIWKRSYSSGEIGTGSHQRDHRNPYRRWWEMDIETMAWRQVYKFNKGVVRRTGNGLSNSSIWWPSERREINESRRSWMYPVRCRMRQSCPTFRFPDQFLFRGGFWRFIGDAYSLAAVVVSWSCLVLQAVQKSNYSGRRESCLGVGMFGLL